MLAIQREMSPSSWTRMEKSTTGRDPEVSNEAVPKCNTEEYKSLLEQAHSRAAELGYSSGACIVQLYVTGAVEENVTKYIAEWPMNSMLVFANAALENLFKPFGSGLIRDTRIANNLEH